MNIIEKGCRFCGSEENEKHKRFIFSCIKCVKKRLSKTAKIPREKHKMSGTRFYTIWSNMKQRCKKNSPCEKSQKYYINKGITVCKRWRSFKNFLEDMLPSYKEHSNLHGEKNTTIDRIDNNGNYEPSNCRWATYAVQRSNAPKINTKKGEYRNVYICENKSSYQVAFKTGKTRISFGTYDDIELAKEIAQYVRVASEKLYQVALATQREEIIKVIEGKKTDERKTATFGEWEAESYEDKMLVNAALNDILNDL